MRIKITTKLLFSTLILAASSMAIGQQSYVAGPIESVGSAGQDAIVLGQIFRIDSGTSLSVNGKRPSSPQVAANLTIGSYAYVETVERSGVVFAQNIVLMKDQYIPGSTTVFVAGKIQTVSTARGLVRVGALEVEISALPPETIAKIAIGSFVEVEGIQPQPRGAVVGPVRLSIGGSGIQDQSIGGSGVQKQSIGGSGVQSQSIGGSGTLSIGGSGVQKQSIGGSGVQSQSIGGSGTLSIGGSGVQKQSIGGSGVQSQSIGGSGTLSIGGSGVQKQSIGGSGIQSQSIGGSGTLSIGGSGLQGQSIGGSGAQQESIGGSGSL